MNQLRNFADERLFDGCIYCGGSADTVDHVPSKILLDKPYPENLPVVDCCEDCNKGYSQDEQYLACLIECVLAGSTDPAKVRRSSIAKTLMHAPALRARIEASRKETGAGIQFVPEWSRVNNVMLKLARGHAAFELSQVCRDEPDHFWCDPLSSLSDDTRESFDGLHIQQMFGEVGSQGSQRLFAAEMTLTPVDGSAQTAARLIFNDWLDVQDDYYRYLAIDDGGVISIRIVIAEYLGCEIGWRK